MGETYTYTNLESVNHTWGAGAGWAGGTPPVSGAGTNIVLGGAGAAGALAAGTAITLDNNLAGDFTLNQFLVTYTGPTSGAAPMVAITGNPLVFVNNGDTMPVLSIISNRGNNNNNSNNSKPAVSIANDIIVGSGTFEISAASNVAAGTQSLVLTGSLSYTDTVPHALTFGGNLGTASWAAAIVDASLGNATSVTKSGTGTWTLSGAHAYTGATNVTGGTLIINQSGWTNMGNVSVADGGQIQLLGASYDIPIAIAGATPADGALRLGANTIVSNTITLTGNARIANTSSTFAQITGRITGEFGVVFGTTTNNTSTSIALSNPLNDYAGDTVIEAHGTSGGTRMVRLDASEVIPHGVGKGNLVFVTSGPGGRAARLDLNGHNETVNGLYASYGDSSAANADNRNTIRNGHATMESTLTIGANNAGGAFMGSLANGGAAKLNLAKIGSGNQIFQGRSTYTGTTSLQGGSITIDYNEFAAEVGSTGSSYFSPNTDLTMAGGTTFAINGRASSPGATQTGVDLNRFAESITVSDATAANMVVGQLLHFSDVVGAGTAQNDVYIVNITDLAGGNTLLNLNKRPAGGSANVTVTVTVEPSVGTTLQTIKSLTLDGEAGQTHVIDFGQSDSVVLTINDIVQTHDGSTLTIRNWSGIAGSLSGEDGGGGAERLIFTGEPEKFAMFTQSEVIFEGYSSGYKIIDGDGFFEVVAVPEPATMSWGVLLAVGLLRRRRSCGLSA